MRSSFDPIAMTRESIREEMSGMKRQQGDIRRRIRHLTSESGRWPMTASRSAGSRS